MKSRRNVYERGAAEPVTGDVCALVVNSVCSKISQAILRETQGRVTLRRPRTSCMDETPANSPPDRTAREPEPDAFLCRSLASQVRRAIAPGQDRFVVLLGVVHRRRGEVLRSIPWHLAQRAGHQRSHWCCALAFRSPANGRHRRSLAGLPVVSHAVLRIQLLIPHQRAGLRPHFSAECIGGGGCICRMPRVHRRSRPAEETLA